MGLQRNVTPGVGLAQVRISADVHKKLKRVAVELEVRISDLLDDLVRKHINDYQDPMSQAADDVRAHATN